MVKVGNASVDVESYSKYGVVAAIEAILIATGYFFVTLGYTIAPFWGVLTLLIFASSAVGILTKFMIKGIPESEFEQAIIKNGGSMAFPFRVMVVNEYGKMLFNEKGILIPTTYPAGQHFYFGRGLNGFPYFLGHKLLIINRLTDTEMSGDNITIQSPVYPRIRNDMLWINTTNMYVAKGVDGYTEYKQYEATQTVLMNVAKSARTIMSGVPEIKGQIGKGISLGDLMRDPNDL